MSQVKVVVTEWMLEIYRDRVWQWHRQVGAVTPLVSSQPPSSIDRIVPGTKLAGLIPRFPSFYVVVMVMFIYRIMRGGTSSKVLCRCRETR